MQRNADPKLTHDEVLRMTAEIVSAYVSYNSVAGPQLPDLIRAVYASLTPGQAAAELAPAKRQKPAAPIGKSVTPSYIVCLEDGKKQKMLKRHLRTAHGMTPEEYRAKWGLPSDYPLVAPNYAAQRSAFAKKIGLGRKARRGRGRRRKR
ncbi:MAG: MucR family transcriptional regulator [Alphaproteobacteria bacterium]